MALVDVLAAVGADARVGRHRRRTARALQHLRRGVQVLIEGGELDLQIAGRDGQRQIDLHLRLALRQRKLLGLVPHSGPILQLDGGLHGPVVVVDDDGAHHLGPLDIGDAQREAVDDVAADQLDNLRRGGEANVGLQRRVLDRRERHLGGGTGQARVAFQVEAVEADGAGQTVVEHRVRVADHQLILFLQQRNRTVHVPWQRTFQTYTQPHLISLVAFK